MILARQYDKTQGDEDCISYSRKFISDSKRSRDVVREHNHVSITKYFLRWSPGRYGMSGPQKKGVKKITE